MKKYRAHIISHSHLDREWYMPYEQHHMRLIELMDNLLDQCENNENYKSFHLDGQSIPLDDYLEVRPQNFDRVYKAVQEGKIKVGPWYILQDAFLTSSEANVRNMQLGHKGTERFGKVNKVGYYPDTFGIYGQAAQMMKLSGVNNLFFGRGVTPTGFNNEVPDSFSSKYSEMKLQSPDGSEVLGILFANWYSNGNEIPNDKVNAKKYWDGKLADVIKFTPYNNLLFMNGCDHQPLQTDVTDAIALANEIYDDVEFVHSSLEDYLKELDKEIVMSDLTTVKGELKSQNTDGYYTLVNTASARVYQKVANVNCQDALEKLAEPLATMFFDEEKYPHDELEYAWKKLIQNHPHDSICGCSHDSAHRSVDMRFEDSIEVSKYIIGESIKQYTDKVNTKGNTDVSFTVFNSVGTTKEGAVEVILNYQRQDFSKEGFQQAKKNMESIVLPKLIVTDFEGNTIDASIQDLGTVFDYDLPKDEFRVAHYARRIKVTLVPSVLPFSWKSFKVIEGTNNLNTDTISNLENDIIKVDVNTDGSISILNKKDNVSYNDIMKIVDQGDVGNEYMFGRVKNDKYIGLTKENVNLTFNNDGIVQECIIDATLKLPKSANKEDLMVEKIALTGFYSRETQRSQELVDQKIQVKLSLSKNDSMVRVNVNLNNIVEDHRLRVLFELGHTVKDAQVDSIFEVTDRTTTVSSHWKNAANDQQMSKFVSVSDGVKRLTVNSIGLAEYEVCNNNELYVTLVRSVSEMGDWGHFETPEAQCLKQMSLDFGIYVSSNENSNYVYDIARDSLLENKSVQLPTDMEGTMNVNGTFLNVTKTSDFAISTLKRNETNDTILRGFANDDGSVKICGKVTETNFIEREEESSNLTYKAKEIKTYVIK